VLLGFRVSKREQTSNYAATDAWLGREIYLHMDGLGLINRK
jgi:hypothetical protein